MTGLIKENHWIGVTVTDLAQFIYFDDTNSFSEGRLVPCENCTTWILEQEIIELKQDIKFLGGTL